MVWVSAVVLAVQYLLVSTGRFSMVSVDWYMSTVWCPLIQCLLCAICCDIAGWCLSVDVADRYYCIAQRLPFAVQYLQADVQYLCAECCTVTG